jgi:site-specific recombinase XerD
MGTLDRGLTAEEYSRLLGYGWVWPAGALPGVEWCAAAASSLALRRRVRFAAVVALMGEAGLRVGEAVGLRWESVIVGGAVVEVVRVGAEIAKGGRERFVPSSAVLREVLAVWRGVVEAWFEARLTEAVLWVPGCAYRPTVRGVEALLARYSSVVLGRVIPPHALRHFAANRWRRVADAFVVQRLLGHADVRTTVRYTSVGGEELRGAVDAATVSVCGSVGPGGAVKS